MCALTPYDYDRLHTFGGVLIRVYQAATRLAAGEALVAYYRTAEGSPALLFPITMETLTIWQRLASAIFEAELATNATTAGAARQLVRRVRDEFPAADAVLPRHWL